MCDLFSWIKCKDGSIWYNTDKDVEREGLDYIDGIGHSAIEKIWKVSGAHCEGILKVPKQLALDVNRGKCAKMAKAAKWAGIHYSAKGEIDSPWWPKDFIKGIPETKFFKPSKKFTIPKNWKVFPTKDDARDAATDAAREASRDAAWAAAWDAAKVAAKAAARDAAWAAAWAAARDAATDAVRDDARDDARDAVRVVAWAAARDAVLVVCCYLSVPKSKHYKYALSRWAVWDAGYGLLCDINGTFYVYKEI